MSASKQPSVQSRLSETDKVSSDFLIAEHSALRAEILKRTEIQHQLISLAVIASGTFISVGVQGSPTVMLAYPILASFLAIAWAQSDLRISQIGAYIKGSIEPRLLGENRGWEHERASTRVERLGAQTLFASRGIIVGTQILTVFVSLLQTNFPTEDIVLLGLDSMFIIFTIFTLRGRKITQPDKQLKTKEPKKGRR